MMSRSRTFKKNTKSHRKKSNVRKSRSFRKKRNAMRGGTYDELLHFLNTRELTHLSTYFSKCSQRDKDKAVTLFNEHNRDPDTLVKKLNILMLNDGYFKYDYDNALYVAIYNKDKFPETWKTILNTKFETPEEYALDDATRRYIIRNQPPAQSQPFVQPPPGTDRGV
jgi:hypothetical protein